MTPRRRRRSRDPLCGDRPHLPASPASNGPRSASTSSRVPRLSSPSSVTTSPMSSTSLLGSPRSVGTSSIRASRWSPSPAVTSPPTRRTDPIRWSPRLAVTDGRFRTSTTRPKASPGPTSRPAGRQGLNSGSLIVCFDVAAVDGEQRLLLREGDTLSADLSGAAAPQAGGRPVAPEPPADQGRHGLSHRGSSDPGGA